MTENEPPSRRIEGIGVTGLANVGTAEWYDPGTDAELEARASASAATDPAVERNRFDDAREQARDELERERDRAAERVGEEEAAVFDVHERLLDDPQLVDGIEAAIADGCSAERAVQRSFADPIERFANMEGRTGERADDLRDVRDRLLRLLIGDDRLDLTGVPEGTVLLADRLTPSDAARLDPERVAGFATVEGGRTSHAAIFARSLGIPAVVGAGDALEAIDDDRTVLVDGDDGAVIVDPDDRRRERTTGGRDLEVREAPVSTADGKSIEVAANVCTPADLEDAVRRGADGIGLFRTEFLFLDREAPPSEDEQYEAYRKALEAFPDERVVVRTLDVGGDKSLPYVDARESDNPFLGERGIRRSLGPDAGLFETQLRALLRAAPAGPGTLSVMFPMVATVPELEAALAAVESVADELETAGVDHELPELGVMIETPSAALSAADLAERVEFLSIGTNDLTQYVMAAAREHDRVGDLHDPREPAVLRAIERTVEAGHGAGVRVAMCGEMAGDPELTELLVGLGLDELSMSAATIPTVKETISEIDATEAASLADRATSATTVEAVCSQLVADDAGDERNGGETNR
ncbi:phosphoenolpyruvate--protein phosphotransferase [Halopiger thermotolerans]